ncbi:MAG: hypothetical protein ACP5P1_14945 [Acidimicrobiales bacterium]
MTFWLLRLGVSSSGCRLVMGSVVELMGNFMGNVVALLDPKQPLRPGAVFLREAPAAVVRRLRLGQSSPANAP